MDNTIVREEPRISVNKLSEYITAFPSRRKTIIKQQKRPPSFIVPYYKSAEEVVIDYLTNNINSEDWLDNRIQQLSDKVVSSDWDETRRNVCIDALDSFVEFAKDLDFGDLRCVNGETDSPKLLISEVLVSVRPELYLINSNKEIKGCIKLVFGKSRGEIAKNEAEYTGVCLQRWLYEQKNISNSTSCFVLDIFGQNSYTAPKAYKKRMNDIEAACEEIARAWAKY